MRKTVTFLVAAAVIIGGIALYQNFNQERGPHLGEGSAPSDSLTKINREGNMEVFATFLSEDTGEAPTELLFKVELRSDTEDLTQYDLDNRAILTNAREERLSFGFNWDGELEETDYKVGFLRVPNQRDDGHPFWEKGVDSLTLVLQDVGGVAERKFHWIF